MANTTVSQARRPPHRHPRDVSESGIGQWLHDNVPRDFDHVDVDFWHHAVSTNTFRLFEEKKPGQTLKPSQERGFTFLAGWIDSAVRCGQLRDGGVYVLWFEQGRGLLKGLKSFNRRGELSGPLLPETLQRPDALVDFFRCRSTVRECLAAWPGTHVCAICRTELPPLESWDYPFQALEDGRVLCVQCWRRHNRLPPGPLTQSLRYARHLRESAAELDEHHQDLLRND